MLAKKFALGFGIAIIFPMVIHYGVSTFSPEPKWKDYQVENYREKHERATPDEQKKMETEQNQLEKKMEVASKRFSKHLFFVAVPVGILAIIVGALLPIQATGTGLMFGGIFSVSDGYFCYWAQLPDSLKFGSMLIAFIVLLLIGYKKLEINKT
jgi:hypothetical protein